jgi:hypothetical protein
MYLSNITIDFSSISKNVLQCGVTYLKVPTWNSSELYDIPTKMQKSVSFFLNIYRKKVGHMKMDVIFGFNARQHTCLKIG